jgi:hypothetical protein
VLTIPVYVPVMSVAAKSVEYGVSRTREGILENRRGGKPARIQGAKGPHLQGDIENARSVD